jgi:type IV pilus biogenesis protein CpaD/CtpE
MSSRFHIVLAGVSLAALGACQHSDQEIAWANRTHTQIVAEESTADLKIDTIVAGEKLGEVEREAVKYFAASYQDEGHGAVIISRPSNGPDDISAIRAAADARAVMMAEGIEPGRIAEGTYDGTGARSAPLIISYRTYNAVVPNCPDISLGFRQEQQHPAVVRMRDRHEPGRADRQCRRPGRSATHGSGRHQPPRRGVLEVPQWGEDLGRAQWRRKRRHQPGRAVGSEGGT